MRFKRNCKLNKCLRIFQLDFLSDVMEIVPSKVFRVGPNDTASWISALDIDDMPFEMQGLTQGQAAVVIQRATTPDQIVRDG